MSKLQPQTPFRELNMDECCRLVLNECPDAYAKAYANAWLDRSVIERAREYGIPACEAMVSQCERILANISRWRGENVSVVRANLKALCSQLD